jgi:hypothetical protein
MWKESSIKVNGEVFHYWMKQYDKGSEWGIDGGRISKLMLKRDGKIVCNYDRGWDIEPADENTQLALEFLLHNNSKQRLRKGLLLVIWKVAPISVAAIFIALPEGVRNCEN